METDRERRIYESEKGNWFKKGGYETVVFVPATPGSKLKKDYEEEIKKTRIKMKVVERAGPSLKSKLQRSDPFVNRGCRAEVCMVCREGDRGKKGVCRRENVTYEIKCVECESRYVGETARNAHTRIREHLSALDNKSDDSVMHRHNTEMHQDNTEPPKWTAKVTGVYPNALTRQVAEAIKIDKIPEHLRINTRREITHNRLPGIQLTVA